MSRGLVVVLFGAIMILGLAPLAYASPASSSGYVAYTVQVTSNGRQMTATANETITPGPRANQSIISLAISSASSNLTYSRFVNSSLALFPYLPAISNQNFTYSGKSYAVSARIARQGTAQVNFQGKAYTVADYAFSAALTSNGSTRSISGSLETFPSDLVYSVSSQFNGTAVTATLVSTSLPLTATSSSPAVQVASGGLAISAAVAAVALGLGVRWRRKQKTEVAAKPEHWVD